MYVRTYIYTRFIKLKLGKSESSRGGIWRTLRQRLGARARRPVVLPAQAPAAQRQLVAVAQRVHAHGRAVHQRRARAHVPHHRLPDHTSHMLHGMDRAGRGPTSRIILEVQKMFWIPEALYCLACSESHLFCHSFVSHDIKRRKEIIIVYDDGVCDHEHRCVRLDDTASTHILFTESRFLADFH